MNPKILFIQDILLAASATLVMAKSPNEIETSRGDISVTRIWLMELLISLPRWCSPLDVEDRPNSIPTADKKKRARLHQVARTTSQYAPKRSMPPIVFMRFFIVSARIIHFQRKMRTIENRDGAVETILADSFVTSTGNTGATRGQNRRFSIFPGSVLHINRSPAWMVAENNLT